LRIDPKSHTSLPYFTKDDINTIESHDNIGYVLPGFDKYYDVFSLSGFKDELLVIKTNENFSKTSNYHLRFGRFFTRKEVNQSSSVCVLSLKSAKEFASLARLEHVEDILGKEIIWNHFKRPPYVKFPLVVIGIIDRGPKMIEYSLENEPMIFIPAYLPFDKLMENYLIHSLYAKLINIDDIDKTSTDLNQMIVASSNKQIIVQSQNERLMKYTTQLISLRKIGAIYAAITLFSATISIISLSFISINNRSIQIGIFRAIGGSRIFIASVFLFEHFILVLFGGIISLIFSITILHVVYHLLLNDFQVVFSFKAYVLSYFVSIVAIMMLFVYVIFNLYYKNIADLMRE
jgi:putative ABC transport system permease protein